MIRSAESQQYTDTIIIDLQAPPPLPVHYRRIIRCRAVVCVAYSVEVEAGGGRANTDEVSDLPKGRQERRDTTRPGNNTETESLWLQCWAE